MSTTTAATLSQLKKSGFQVQETPDGLFLVYPSRNKFDWAPHELGFRSALLGPNGNIVSVGWPKFFNQGEWPEHDARIAAALSAGTAVITHKHDGSLIIRSVLPGGRVVFRTRGTADGGDYGAFAHAVAEKHYPSLLDPTVFPEGSLLFEYVGAGNQIVVRYEGDDDLIFLGAAYHTEPVQYLSFADLSMLASKLGLRLVETYDWSSSDGIATVLGLIQDWSHAEGVVVRTLDGQTMLKIKSAWYFAQHALRWHMTYASIVRFVIDGAITDEPGLVAGLSKAGWDFEIITKAREHFAVYQERRAQAATLKDAAYRLVADFDRENPTFPDERARRKAFAALLFGADARPESRALLRYAFFAYDNKESALESALLRYVVYAA